jgi:hypothetical protein
MTMLREGVRYMKFLMMTLLGLNLVTLTGCNTSKPSAPCRGCDGSIDAALFKEIHVLHAPRSDEYVNIRTRTRKFELARLTLDSNQDMLVVRTTSGEGMETVKIPWVEISELPCWLLADRGAVLFHAVQAAFSANISPSEKAANMALVQRNARYFTAAEYSKIMAAQSEMDHRNREEEKRIAELRKQGYVESQGQWVRPAGLRQQGNIESQGR